ncbi:CDP-glycerol glycerophosphotransferase family protein [Streptomyces sp. NPDC091281]|uniref:bifunctional glycosyltransferase/CDP-glycerol:glycerophosphate glycerophosphotransferase n=1 Tax=Streptomyces sp. NPDC091281 TaxID=3365985 RepID=UPI003808CCFA
MPRFSVVVACPRGERGFLRACLDSVLDQPYRDVEVIAVTDRSPGGCGPILDEYVLGDPRVRAVRLPRDLGPGGLRDAGLAHARGERLLFLGAGDTLTPGALGALADRLDETGDPDVLLFDHARTSWWDGTRRDPAAHLLAAPGDSDSDGDFDGTFTAAEHPGVLGLPAVAWNKAYRRAFVLENGFRFPPGAYGQLSWTYAVLLGARRIAALERICVDHVDHRPHRTPAPDRPPYGRPAADGDHPDHGDPFDLHAQYERVFALLDARPALGAWRPEVHRRMGAHCLALLADPDALPRSARAAFFRRTAALSARHRPRGAPLPAELRVLEGTYAGFVARRLAARATGAARTVGADRNGAVPDGAGRAGAGARAEVGERARRGVRAGRTRRAPDPDLVVYAAAGYRGALGDPGAVHRAARVIAPRLRGVWVVRDEACAAGLPEGTEHVLLGSPEHHRVAARAGFVVTDLDGGDLAGLPAVPAGRPDAVHIQTHRGTPLAYRGADLLERPGARLGVDVPELLRRADRWDHSLVANAHSELVWERAFPCRFAAARTGSPRNDVLVNAGPEAVRRARARLGVPAGNTVVLYAPARRAYRRGGYVEAFDPARLAADLGAGHTLVVRLHPSLADGPARALGLAELHRRGVLVDATGVGDAAEVMLAADVLVTDYASLMCDYVLLDRPVVVHAHDVDAFRASRGLYVDVTAEGPGHVTRAYGELAEVLVSGGWRDAESARRRAAFRDRFRGHDDGRAAERVVRTLLLGQEMPAAPVAAPPAAPVVGGARGLSVPVQARADRAHSMG